MPKIRIMRIYLVVVFLCLACLPTAYGLELSPERLEWLRIEIRRHDELYYETGEPEISDLEYDRLKKELVDTEALTERTSSGSISGSDISKHAHRVPMLSLEKAYEIGELQSFHGECARNLGTEELEYWIEPKVDGVAISAVYEHGYLVRVLTRGDGERGKDIGERLVHSGCLPARLQMGAPEFVEVRGEAYIPMEAFERINVLRKDEGLPAHSNPRNLATGTLMGVDEDTIIGRGIKLVFFGWGAWEPDANQPVDYTEYRDWLQDNGLPAIGEVELVRGSKELLESVRRLQRERDGWPFAADGLVVKLNSTHERERMGWSAIGPNWAVAWKFPPDTEESVIESIVWQMGRTGRLTPVAEFKQVVLKGRKIQRASLHNLATLKYRGFRVGDQVRVELAGDVIPAVYPIAGDKRSANNREVPVPVCCPWCSGKLIQSGTGASLDCPNISCPERVKRQLDYFCKTLGMRDVKTRRMSELVDKGIIRGFQDVFSTQEQIQGLSKTMSLPLWRKIQSLGLPGIGKVGAKEIAEEFGSLKEWMKVASMKLDAQAVELVSAAAGFWE
ncbi:MAG: NAD-dependent DNA ligase LigA [Puniceicoccaceae bacterium]